jgi:hypothetical protein
MTGSRQEDYEAVLRALQTMGLRSRNVLIDFEAALRAAWQAVFPSDVLSCLFHYRAVS